ncbi:hypothetical protein ABWJ92_33830 [Streptomyces sp. NPDC000609]|uniref:hypothetical protein n=1 Tax=Streptomyces sp. NPDC000609 TaxID=3160957 RepID=UPI00339A5249
MRGVAPEEVLRVMEAEPQGTCAGGSAPPTKLGPVSMSVSGPHRAMGWAPGSLGVLSQKGGAAEWPPPAQDPRAVT